MVTLGAPRATRVLAGLGTAYGALLLARPRAVVHVLCPELPEAGRWAVPLLGARLVVQHGVLLARPSSSRLRAGAVVDALHAASMLPLLRRPRYRRAAAISGGVAVASAVAAALAAGR